MKRINKSDDISRLRDQVLMEKKAVEIQPIWHERAHVLVGVARDRFATVARQFRYRRRMALKERIMDIVPPIRHQDAWECDTGQIRAFYMAM